MIAYFAGLATGLFVSAVTACVLWPIYIVRCRQPGETWDDARKREIARLDRLAELDEIPDTQRCCYENDRNVN